MADYYHTARAAKKQIENTQKQNKRNRERLAELRGVDPGAEQIEHPLNLLSIDGRSAKIYRTSPEQHAATERMEGLIPWNGDPDNLIDRFDCRCMLDFYREPPSVLTNEHKAAGDPKLLQLVQFESFRDLVKYASKGYTDEMGIEAALEESIAVRAQARVEANAAFRIQSHQALPGDETTAGQGPYSAVGFNYGNTAQESDSSSSSDSDDSDGDQNANEEEDEQDKLDEAAEEFGITNFSWRLHRALQQEGEEEANRRMPRKRSNRKRMRMRMRRMAGNGLDIHGNPLNSSFWRDPLVTGAPSAHLVRPRRPSPPRSSSRSLSPPRRARDPLASIRDLPSVPAQTIDRKAFEKDDNIIDALPDMPDPAMSGPQAFPAASALQNIRVQQESQRRDRRRSRSPVRDRDRERGYYRRRSRSRSRDRYSRRSRSSRSRSRERGRDWDRRYSSRRRSGSRSSSSRSRSRSRSRSPHGDEDRGGSASQRPKPAAPAQPSKAAPETPAERMKRITQAQLNKQRATDSMKGTLNKKR